MSASWYYVEGGDRQGPVDESVLIDMIRGGKLNSEDYIWTKGYDNWKQVKEVSELNVAEPVAEEPAPLDIPAPAQTENFDISSVDVEAKIFSIRIGVDRGSDSQEYGPYSLNMLKRLFDEKRINGKTMIFTAGLGDWKFLGELDNYQTVFSDMPPKIEEVERRSALRKPFVARMFFHNNSQLFEGICRDISVGGMQVLVSGFPGKIGEKISMNVHPENTDYCFVASGKIVRVLEGGQGFSFRFTSISAEAQSAIEKYIELE